MASGIVARNLRRKITRSVKGPKPEETKATGSRDSASVTEVEPSGETKAAGSGVSASETKPNGESFSAKVSTDEPEDPAIIALIVAAIGGLGWISMSNIKKIKNTPRKAQD